MLHYLALDGAQTHSLIATQSVTPAMNHEHSACRLLFSTPCCCCLQVAQLHNSCSQVLRGLAPLTHPTTRCSTSLVSTLPDGRPLVGSHPGFDAGRVVVCCGVAGSERFGPGSSSSSYQLSPMLAKLAADVVKAGGGSPATDGALLSAVSLQREGLGVSESLQQLDAWEGLGRLQQQAQASAIQQEEQQDLARDAEQDMVGTRQ